VILHLVRLYFVASVAMAITGMIVLAPGFQDFTALAVHQHLEIELSEYGVPFPSEIVRAALLVGTTLKLGGFASCAFGLAWLGRRDPLALVLAAGMLGYGVGLGLYWSVPPNLQAVPEVNHLFAVNALIGATLLFPGGRFSRRWHALLAAGWAACTWLLLCPTGLPWAGLRYSPWRVAVEAGLLLTGLAVMASRYREMSSIQRLQVRWLLSGVASGALGFLLVLILPDGWFSELFYLLGYPVLACFAPAATVVASLRLHLWDLADVRRRAVILLAVAGIAASVTEVAHAPWLFGPESLPGWFVVAVPVVSALAVGLTRQRVVRIVDRVLFPEHGKRRQAVAQGIEALDDVLAEWEGLWVVESLFAHGWPGSIVSLFHRVNGMLIPFVAGVAGAEPRAEPDCQAPIRFTGEGDEGERVLWMMLHQGTYPLAAVRVSPPPERGFSNEDLEMLNALRGPLAAALWRLKQGRG